LFIIVVDISLANLVLCNIFLQVIYALNTKNDESETVAAHAEQLHEEQLNKVYEEMQMKIEHYRQVYQPLLVSATLFVSSLSSLVYIIYYLKFFYYVVIYLSDDNK